MVPSTEYVSTEMHCPKLASWAADTYIDRASEDRRILIVERQEPPLTVDGRLHDSLLKDFLSLC